MRREYIGGAGINTKILYDSDAMHHDALSEKNVLIFGVGPAVGTGLLAGNRCTITAKSALTDLYGDTNVGGDFTLAMRSVGIDHLVFVGKSDVPVYLFIDQDSNIQILSAEDIWGMMTDEATDVLEERHGKSSEVACIGPAGENLIRFANVIMSKCHAAGRMGLGCIMGSKRLKAIVIERRKKVEPPVSDKSKIDEIRKLWLEKCRKSVVSKMGSIEGTLFLIETYDKDKHVPVSNCKASYDEKTKNIYSSVFKNKYQTRRKACYACPVGCAKEYEIKEGQYKGDKGDRIDYGTVASLGTCLGIFDWAGIIHLKILTDQYGIDTVEYAGVVAMLMECEERGRIDPKETDGIKVEFGNTEHAEYLMHKMCRREGIGDLLAEGAYRAAKAYNTEEYSFCINKSTTGLQSRGRLAWSLGYVTSTRGGDHLKNFPFTVLSGGYLAQVIAKHIFKMDARKLIDIPEKQGRIVWWHENYKYVVDSLGICIFAIHGLPNTGHAFFDEFADVMNGLYGIKMSERDVFLAGDRMYQLQNSFNVLCGLTLDKYKWPDRKKDDDIDDEFLEDSNMNELLEKPGMLPEYFQFRGLTNDGKPTQERFKELGLEEYISKSQIKKAGDVKRIDDLLQELGLSVKLTITEKIKGNLLSALLCKLLEKKDQKERKQYLKQQASKADAIK
jgi:aldehyde:ferredoxin oxidoreductase